MSVLFEYIVMVVRTVDLDMYFYWFDPSLHLILPVLVGGAQAIAAMAYGTDRWVSVQCHVLYSGPDSCSVQDCTCNTLDSEYVFFPPMS